MREFFEHASTAYSSLGWEGAKMSVMFFLQFAIWGAWFVVLGNYLNSLGFSRKEIARVYATMPLGSIIAPMFAGTIADQFFPAQQSQYAIDFYHYFLPDTLPHRHGAIGHRDFFPLHDVTQCLCW